MKRKYKYILLYIMLIWVILFFVDFARMKNSKIPIFAFYTASYEDGGSKRYTGLFYNVFHLNYYNPNMEENWFKDDGSIKDEYKEYEYIKDIKIVPWFYGIDKLKEK
ncbi:MAG: hypothetical protein WC006_02380 [Bacilli bacterium]